MSLFLLFIILLQVLKDFNEVFSKLFHLQAEQPSQPFFMGEILQISDHLHGPPLNPLHVLPMLWTPELDALLQAGSHEGRVEGVNHLA